MRRRTRLLLATMLGALVLVLAACGGGSNASRGDETTGSSGGGSTTASGDPYNVRPSLTSLQGAGWQANETEGIPDTYTGVQQVGYLETTAPDGESVDMQFFANPDDAQRELEETKKKEAPFDGTLQGNVMVFDPDNDTAEVSQGNLDAVQKLLA